MNRGGEEAGRDIFVFDLTKKKWNCNTQNRKYFQNSQIRCFRKMEQFLSVFNMQQAEHKHDNACQNKYIHIHSRTPFTDAPHSPKV